MKTQNDKKKRVRKKGQYCAATIRNLGNKYEKKDWPFVLSRQGAITWARKYGATIEDVARAEHAQGRKCGVCQHPLKNDRKGYHMDHSHDTVRFRGILCGPCNMLVGYLEKYAHLVSAAQKWIEEK